MTGHIRIVKPNVREQLLDKGLQVLHERGFNATSVQDITEAAGVPKGSFYNHFESKEDLGAEVVLRYLESSNETQAVLRDPKHLPNTLLVTKTGNLDYTLPTPCNDQGLPHSRSAVDTGYNLV